MSGIRQLGQVIAAAGDPGEAATAALMLIGDWLTDNPANIVELCPDLVLVPRRKPVREASAANLEHANAERQARRQKQVELVAAEVRKALQFSPTMSHRHIAIWLDNEGVKPPRRAVWEPRAVRRLMKEVGIERQE